MSDGPLVVPVPAPTAQLSEVVWRCRGCQTLWQARCAGTKATLQGLEAAEKALAEHRPTCAGPIIEPYVITNDPEVLQALGALSCGPRGVV